MIGEEWERFLVLAGLCAVAAAFTALLRWAGSGQRNAIPITAWAMLGGTLAGLLMGPTIGGRVWPTHYEQWFSGGIELRQQRDQLISRQGADVIAASHMQFDDEHRTNLRVEHEQELAAITTQWRQAQWSDQALLRYAALVLVAVVLFLGGMRVVRSAGDTRQSALTPISIGLGTAIIPGGIGFVALSGWWHVGIPQAALVSAALAIGPWTLTLLDRQAADDAEFGGARMMQFAGRIATIIAMTAAAWALWTLRGIDGLLIAATLLALPLAWTIGPRWNDSRAVQAVVEFILLPALAAFVAVKIEWIEHFSIWPLIVILLLSDDGRWLGAFLGAMLPGGRRALRTTRLVIGSMSCGVTQLAMAAIAVHATAIPEFVVLPLLVGSLLTEFTAPMRRNLVNQLKETEIEVD